MIDINIMQESFLCNWFYKLLTDKNNSKWSLIPRMFLRDFGSDLTCFSSTVGPNRFKGLNKIKLCFWKKVMSTWLFYNKDSKLFETKLTCIWNNNKITYLNNIIFFDNWTKKITYIKDIIKDDGTIKNLREIETLLGPSPSLHFEYMIVRAAVMSYIKKTPVDTNIDRHEDKWSILKGKSTPNAKQFRIFINNFRYSEPCATRFWLNKFNIVLDDQFFTISNKVTKESRLRELHWKIVHNIYPTNILLFKMGIANSNKCTYCQQEIDFIEHFFFECKEIRKLWTHIESLFQTKLGKRIIIKKEDALLGKKRDILNTDMFSYLNHLILIGKMCISKFRYGTPADIIIMLEKEMSLREI